MTLDECEVIFDKVRATDSEPDLCAAYRALLAVYPVINFEFAGADTYWRGRKCDSHQGYKNVSALCYPPPDFSRAGRLNAEGKSCFYATEHRDTVFPELQLQRDEYVHIIGVWRMLSETIRFIALGELYHVYKAGYMRTIGSDPDRTLANLLDSYDIEDARRIVFIDKFFATILSDPKAHEDNYVRTRCLAAEAFRKIPQAEGLFYPSVQDNGGMCLALTPSTYDRKMRIVCSKVIRISRVRSFGFYDHEVCLEATGISDNGDFIWRKPLSARSEHYFNLTKEEFEDMKERSARRSRK
jgi:hypothetical protein